MFVSKNLPSVRGMFRTDVILFGMKKYLLTNIDEVVVIMIILIATNR